VAPQNNFGTTVRRRTSARSSSRQIQRLRVTEFADDDTTEGFGVIEHPRPARNGLLAGGYGAGPAQRARVLSSVTRCTTPAPLHDWNVIAMVSNRVRAPVTRGRASAGSAVPADDRDCVRTPPAVWLIRPTGSVELGEIMNRRLRGLETRRSGILRSAPNPNRCLGSQRGRHQRAIVGSKPRARLERAAISPPTPHRRCRKVNGRADRLPAIPWW
jgi:hypothetical protein